MTDCFDCSDVVHKIKEIRRLHTVCRQKNACIKTLIQTGENVLTFLTETTNIDSGDVYEDLANAIAEAKNLIG